MMSHTLKVSLATAVALTVAAAMTACGRPGPTGEAASAAANASPPSAATAARSCDPSDYACSEKRDLDKIVEEQDREANQKKFFDDLNRNPAGQQPGSDVGGDAAKKW
jgi:hypothetical protein